MKKHKPYKPYKDRIALISGITGQDGSILAGLLLEKGYKKVVGLKRRTSTISTSRVDHIFNHTNFYLEYGNMTDTYSLYRVMSKYKPDEIYNLAAQSDVRASFDIPEETLDVDGMGTLKLLNAYKEICPKSRFYQASTSEMYGDNPVHPQNEETRMMPASPYAAAKLYAHHLCRNYRKSYGLHISCGILFNHEGERRGETFVTRKITQAAARIKLGKQETLELGNLDAKRDWGYAKDFVEGMFLMLQQDTPDDYVLATGETHTVREFLEEVFNHANLSVDEHVRFNKRLLRPQEVPYLLGDASKAKKILGWTSKTKFKELAKLMYEADLEKELEL